MIGVGALAVLLLFFALKSDQTSQSSWILTQYPQLNGAQGMCYTLEDEEGHLILIDGGWDMNAELVLNKIVEHNSHVDAWIITHSHQDHVSVFNNLSAGGFGFTIGEVICPDLNREFYAKYANSADGGFEYYEAFRENLTKWDNVHFAHAGDELSLCGLHVKIFNAFEMGNTLYEDDPENKGSLVFKIEGSKDSALFCADATKPLAKALRDRWGKELKADILQVSHHGVGWCMPASFNLYVEPETAFFDAPSALLMGDEKAADRVRSLQGSGCKVYTFDTAPNSVEFY